MMAKFKYVDLYMYDRIHLYESKTSKFAEVASLSED